MKKKEKIWAEVQPKIYDEKYHDIKMEELVMEGLTLQEIAEKLAVEYRTLTKWLVRYPSLAEAFNRGRIPRDLAVENALYKRAIGYTYEEKIAESTGTMEEAEGKKRAGKFRRVTKHMPPDVEAIKMWLSNKKPHLWSNTQKIDVTSKGQQMPIVMIGAPPEEEK